ncbi:DUF1648 domain-containing protein [Tessaracoccus rhinocerotis]|uniref:DUF1648 domain-containing protein n=1 Tax=Tessaracoccus rhinocerotis TaxID=1689449 RepID=UPI00163DC095|nr:DUF1648 domain-containing protein [Tessaracoccus rhinocerotis]
MSVDRTPDHDRVLARAGLLGLWLPLVLLAVVVVAQVILLPRMPDPAAVHWGPGGKVDGWGPAWSFPLLTALVGGGIVVLTGVASRAGRKRSGGPLDLRFVSAMNLWLVGFLGSLTLLLVVLQLDLDDASAVAVPFWMILPSLALGILMGALGWFLTPRIEAAGPTASTPDAVALRPGEHAVWLKTAAMSPLAVGLILVAVVSSFAFLAFSLVAAAASPEAWVIGGSTLLLGVLVTVMTVFRVRVDGSGLSVRSAVGWPRVHVPIDEIATVEVVHVNPLGDFGGWGWRFNPGYGQGIVMRTGEALRVTRTNGKKLTVTVDDAATAAALLRGLKDRSRA